MNGPVARFEFRLFGQSLESQERRLRAMAPVGSITESRETYLVGTSVPPDRNVKIRDGRLEVKQLVARHGELERWQPGGQWEFPVDSATLLDVLPLADGARWRSVLPPRLSGDELMSFVARPEVDCLQADVFKRRFRFELSPCRAEFDQLLVNGVAIQSVAIEAEDPLALRDLQSGLQIGNRENLSFPRALSRILGLGPRSRA
jgi:hypothetical protein